MFRSNRRGWSVPQVRFFVLLVSIAIASLVSATEPDGHVQLQMEWVQANAEEGPLVVRLGIRSYAPLDAVTLTVTTPVDFALRPLMSSVEADFQDLPVAQDRHAIRTDLRPLDPAVLSTLDFELILSPGGNGTLEFIVEGLDKTGRRIRNAVGLAVRESGSAGVLRLGAVEFPAVVLPPTEER